jgi:DNA-binding NarL/FixJ family response regulator
MKHRVLIYEDNDRLREGLESMLGFTENFELVGSFPNCETVDKQVKSLHPDIILMDIDMPGINGIQAVKQIRSFNQQVQILMITIFDDSTHVFDAIYQGANGYLLKKNISTRLVQSMEECLAGGAPMSPSIARMVVAKLQGPQTTKPDYALTERETSTLRSLAQGNSFKMISNDLGISIDTVRTHIKRIYEKLHVHSQTEAVIKAIRENIV